MRFHAGQIIKYSQVDGWFLLKVDNPNLGTGVVIKSNLDGRFVGEGNTYTWNYNDPHCEHYWSAHKESNILRLLEKVDAL